MTPGQPVFMLLDPTPGRRSWAVGTVVRLNTKTVTLDLTRLDGTAERVRVPKDDVAETIQLNLGPVTAPHTRGRRR